MNSWTHMSAIRNHQVPLLKTFIWLWVFSLSHLLTCRGGVYKLYCSQPAWNHLHVLASLLRSSCVIRIYDLPDWLIVQILFSKNLVHLSQVMDWSQCCVFVPEGGDRLPSRPGELHHSGWTGRRPVWWQRSDIWGSMWGKSLDLHFKVWCESCLFVAGDSIENKLTVSKICLFRHAGDHHHILLLLVSTHLTAFFVSYIFPHLQHREKN